MSTLTNEQLDLLTERANSRLGEFGNLLALPKLAPGVVRIVHDVIDEWWNELDVDPPAPKSDDAGELLTIAYGVGYERGKAAANPPEPDTSRLVTNSAPAPSLESSAEFAAHWPELPDLEGVDRFAEHPVTGMEKAVSEQAAAVLGPEHTVVAPLKSNGNGHAASDTPEPSRKTTKPAPTHPWVKASTLDGRTPPRLPNPDVAREQLAEAVANGSGGEAALAIGRPVSQADKQRVLRAEREKELEEIIAALREMAVDGEMPSITTYNLEKPSHLPAWSNINYRHAITTWGTLAERAGLHYNPQRKGTGKAVGVFTPDLAQLVKELQRQAMANTMPTQAAFDAAKPANWATAVAHCKRLNMNWNELAAEAGLKPNPRGVRVEA